MANRKDSLARQFIDTYNRIDKALRDIFNLKPSISYSDAVRRASAMSSIVRKYEDDLIDFGRLRNAIVHRATDTPIAEPHEDIVEKFKQIERIITTPPLAMQIVGNRAVTSMSAEISLAELIKEMYKTGYSNIPVYLDKTIIGVVNRKMIIDSFGRAILNGVKLEDLFKQKVVDALEVYSITAHYEVVSEKATIDHVLFMFQQNRKLSVVLITQNGDYTKEALGIVTTADVIDMQDILDNY